MNKSLKNKLHIYYIQDGQEIHKIIHPDFSEKINSDNFKSDVIYDLYYLGYKEVCKLFNVSCLKDLSYKISWCWDSLSIVLPNSWDERIKIFNTNKYRLYQDMIIKSKCSDYVKSMFNNAYYILYKAYKNLENLKCNKKEKLCNRLKSGIMEEILFTQGLKNKNYISTGGLIFRDGSCVAVDFGFHNAFIEACCGLKERKMEKYWVKISGNYVYTHNNITKCQWKTLANITEKHPTLSERKIGEW